MMTGSVLGAPLSIVNFDASITNCVGFVNHGSRSVPQFVQGISNDTVMPLARPDCMGNQIAVATECSDGANYLIFVDGEELLKLRSTRVLLGVLPLNQSVQDVRWIDNEHIVCATADLQLGVFQLNSAQQTVALAKSSAPLHRSRVRELAVQSNRANNVASGGSDGILNVVDLSSLSVIQSATLHSKVISSTKWTQFNENVCVSVTVEDGDYHMFDIRSDMDKPAVSVNLIKSDLFTHCRFSDHNVLLGYGDGEMKHIDMRKPQNVICSVTDPWVEGIGGIEFNPLSQSFAVSGFTDCSVWRAKPDGIARVLSHTMTGSNTLVNQNAYSTAASFLQSDMIVVGDSAGRLAVFQQPL